MKADQDRLNGELDFIETQQRELEQLLSPLETTVQQQSSSFGSHLIDKEREQMYTSACELDIRLQQMCHDLTEVIEKLNKSYGGQNNNPMQQVTKILNSHTEALKWIDKNVEFLKRKVDNVVSQSEIKRNEQEHSLRLVSPVSLCILKFNIILIDLMAYYFLSSRLSIEIRLLQF